MTKSENILVTGARGFLGKYICKMLLKSGHKVWGFSRTEDSELIELGVKWITGDISNLESLTEALKGKDGVFHVASKVGMWGNYEDFYKTNVIGALNIIKASKINNVSKLVYTSTPSVVFGKDDLCGVDESVSYPKKFLTHYAATKAEAEREILNANGKDGLLTCSIRPHLIFGKDDPNLIPRLVEAAKKKRLRIVGDGKNLIDVIHVENAAESHIKAYNELSTDNPKNQGKAYFIGQEKPVNCWDFINKVLQIKGVAPIEKNISISKLYIIGLFIEYIFKLFRIKNIEPPMTSFIALQLGKSHYFDQSSAQKDFGHSYKISLDQAFKLLK